MILVLFVIHKILFCPRNFPWADFLYKAYSYSMFHYEIIEKTFKWPLT